MGRKPCANGDPNLQLAVVEVLAKVPLHGYLPMEPQEWEGVMEAIALRAERRYFDVPSRLTQQFSQDLGMSPVIPILPKYPIFRAWRKYPVSPRHGRQGLWWYIYLRFLNHNNPQICTKHRIAITYSDYNRITKLYDRIHSSDSNIGLLFMGLYITED